nr:unnamed protein product [Digitaria exilis]
MRFGDPSGDPILDGLLPLFGGGDIALRGGLGLLLMFLRGRPPLTGLLLTLLLGILTGLLLKLLRMFLRGLLIGLLLEGLCGLLEGLRLTLRDEDLAEVRVRLLLFTTGLLLIRGVGLLLASLGKLLLGLLLAGLLLMLLCLAGLRLLLLLEARTGLLL